MKGLLEVQSNENELLVQGHKLVSEELIELLILNIEKYKERISEGYEYLGGDESEVITDEEKKKINDFLGLNICGDDMTIDLYNEKIVDILALEWFFVSKQSSFDTDVRIKFDTIDELIVDLEKIPKETHSISLANNRLYEYSAIELKDIFSALPKTVKHLSLANNGLKSVFGKSFRIAMQQLSKKLKVLDLSGNGLGDCTEGAFNEIIRYLPPKFRYLNLANNNLSKIMNILKYPFAGFPKGMRGIDLSYNNLATCDMITVYDVLCRLPDSMAELNLSYNGFESWDSDWLIPLFRSFPSKLEVLNISYNDLGKIPIDKLKELFAGLPKDCKIVNIKNCNLGKYTKKELGIRDGVKIVGKHQSPILN